MSGRSLDQAREEHFDIYDAAGKSIGTATRSEVHAKGYWHRSFHCWLARREGSRRLVMFQLRQSDKDTFPGRFDITAAGHLTAGETMPEAVREIEEELGVSAAFDMLIPLGETRNEAEGSARGVPFIDREISEVFVLLYAGPPASMRLQAEEVAGVYECELEAMIDLFEGRRRTVTAAGVSSAPQGGLTDVSVQVSAADFVTRPYAYYAGVFRSLLLHT